MEFKMTDRTYNCLKWIAMTVLPAAGAFYGIIAHVLDLPYTAEILTIAEAAGVFLCTILGISTENYKRRIAEGKTDEIYR